MITEIQYLDCCTAGFFQGSEHIVLAVPVCAGMTYAELREEIDNDSNACDHGVDDWKGFEQALKSVFDNVDSDETCDFLTFVEDEPEDSDEDWESCYAYFALIQNVE